MSPVLTFVLGLVVAAVVAFAFGRRSAARAPATLAPVVAAPIQVTPVETMASLAIESLPIGLVLFGVDGAEIFRNHFARSVMAQRHLGPIVSASVGDVARDPDGVARKSLDLYGPPRRNIDLSAMPVVSTRGKVGSMVIISDVTEQRRVDEVRRDFVANVSHELKTPVGAISLLAEALMEEDDPEIVDRLTGRLQLESLRLGSTIDDLLALSEIESDQLQPMRVEIDEIIAGALARSSGGALQRAIDLRVDKSAERLMVLGDRRQLVSALGNLVDNAVKYSDPGSEIWIRASGEDDRVVLRVEDRGVGIPQADLGRIFERFYRVDPGRSRNTGGTGLGLSIVRHVIMNHNGHVAVASTEGVGTTFTLYLPALLDREVEDVPLDGGPSPFGTANVEGSDAR